VIVRVIAIAVALAAPAGAAAPDYVSVAREIAALLQTRSLIGLGESHRRANLHAAYRAIIGNPAVFCRIDDIVVEFGNAYGTRLGLDTFRGWGWM